MSGTVRFAPSPTGLIHIGNARTALTNWFFARKTGARYVLRFDDTDRERSRAEYAEAIAADLDWLGVSPDHVARQSERIALHDAAAGRLRAAGLLYPCYETPDELERKRRRQQARGLPPVYDRAALALTEEERRALEAGGRRPHWRFRLEGRTVIWRDLVRGESRVDCASLSDPVLIRADGGYLYTLPSVVDDIDLGVTHVIRGDDHVTNTGVQIQIFEALAGAAPAFGHHNLLTDAAGAGLSKRSGALSIRGLREAGIEPLAIAALATLTGSSEAVRPVASQEALIANFDLSHISRGPARFDPAELTTLSARTLHLMEFDAVASRLAARGVAGAKAPDFWMAVRGNLTRFEDVDVWRAIVEGPLTPVIEDAEFLAAAAAALPESPFDGSTWRAWTDAIKARTGRKGRALFHPLRLALTGREDGPELAALLPLIGRLRGLARLSGLSA